MLVSLTVGKVDAGVAVLLTEDKRLIEFPSILLPPSITSGSIVDITVAQNHDAEQKSQASFDALQARILNTYGLHSPSPPNLRLRGATQTSLVLEWDPIQLATSTLRSLALYRNGSKAGSIPRPLEMYSTKISGLAVDTEYSFHMVLRTSGGTFSSPTLTFRTHKMTDLSGITVTPGIMHEQLRSSLERAVQRIGGRFVDAVRIDTTHFVCTEPGGTEWERAVAANIPVVRPEWVEGCEREGRIVGVRGYYLDANPKHREVGVNPALNARQATHGSSEIAVGGRPGNQTRLPSRLAPEQVERGSRASRDMDGPGPEVPPTPPTKDEVFPPSAEDDNKEEAAHQKELGRQISADSETIESSRNKEVLESGTSGQRASVEDAEEGGGEMDEVPL